MRRTAEFVSPKHPDKICDRISDALVDEYLKVDPNARCAIEVMGGHGEIYITGEVTSNGVVTKSRIQDVASEISETINWSDVRVNIVKQSSEIAQGVDIGGAGDQGIMIGYACNDNELMIPQEYYLAMELNKEVYKSFPYDGKTQVTIHEYPYQNNVDVVCSFQNAPKEVLEDICKKFFEKRGLNPKYLHCNPAGDWNIGGFDSDTGLTGRKLVVDNYGPQIPIGGGAFSGKDSTKVDRSGAYMARKIAVDYLKKYEAEAVLVRLAYAIGYPLPIEATAIVDGTASHITFDEYDLEPQSIIDFLDLRKPIFKETAEWGHFTNPNFKWNK